MTNLFGVLFVYGIAHRFNSSTSRSLAIFTFEPRDEGLLVVHENGRAIAHIDTRTIHLSDHVDGDPKKPKLARETQIVTPIPCDKWQIHFTGYKFTPEELKKFLEELDMQPE